MLTQKDYAMAFAGAELSAVCVVGCSDLAMAYDDQVDTLKVPDVRMMDGAINGIIVNHTARRLANIHLRVTSGWRWWDKFKLAPASPAWTSQVDVPVVLAPGESYKFHFFPDEGLSDQCDRSCYPTVSVMNYREYPCARA